MDTSDCADYVNGIVYDRVKTERDALRAEVETLKKVIAWANNSLYGSHGFFLSDCGGEPNEHHLDSKIEDIKTQSRKTYSDLAAAVGVLHELDNWAKTCSPVDLIKNLDPIVLKLRAFLARMEGKP